MVLSFLFLRKESTMAKDYNRYLYEGPVMEFNRCIDNHWVGETYAVTKTKARSNLVYQYKKEYGKVPATKISLPGEIKLAN